MKIKKKIKLTDRGWMIEAYDPLFREEQRCPACNRIIKEIAFCEFCGEPLFDIEDMSEIKDWE